jgi:hypothetical protein
LLALRLAFDMVVDHRFSDLHRSPPQVVSLVTVVELQEQLLAQEEQLTLHEDVIAIQEKGIEVVEWVLGMVSLELNGMWTKTEATRQGYLEKLQAHTARMKHTVDLNKILGETKVLLVEQK